MSNLERELCKEDVRFHVESGIPPEILIFQRIYNPLHFYCRLRELGVEEPIAKQETQKYEQIYNLIKGIIKDGEHSRGD